MTDTPATTRTHQGPILVEWVTLAYTLFTTLLIVLFWSQMGNPLQLLEGRGMVVGGMALLWLFYHLRPNKYILLLRYIFPLSLLGYWYPDTYEFCQLFPNLDYLFAAADHALFGCQPSITFAQWLPQKVWSELFHMGYFAYYPLIFLTVLAPLFTDRSQFSRTAFVVLASFFLYYLIYLFLPVAGPQYYFHAVGTDVIQSAHFPQLGNYFRYHTELSPSPGPDGFFRELVENTQKTGEAPHGSLSVKPCGHEHGAHATVVAQPSLPVCHSLSVLHLPVRRHSIYSGALPGRRVRWFGNRPHLLQTDRLDVHKMAED